MVGKDTLGDVLIGFSPKPGAIMRTREAIAMLSFVLSACSSESPTIGGASVPTNEALTAEAATLLDKDGKFRIAAAQGADELTGLQATALAVIFAKQFRWFSDSLWAAQRGISIDYDGLRACGRPLYAESSYEPLPIEHIRPTRSAFGSWWLVTLCDGAGRALAVGVSALATDLRIEGGRILFPRVFGSEFEVLAIPPGRSGFAEYRGPEQAAVTAFAKTGARVRSTPVLVAGRQSVGPSLQAAWRVELERQVRLRGERRNSIVSKDVVYVGIVGRVDGELKGRIAQEDALMLPDDEQPATEPFGATYSSNLDVVVQAEVRRKPSSPLVYQSASTTE